MSIANIIEKQWKLIAGAAGLIIVAGAIGTFISINSTHKEMKAQENYFVLEKKLLDMKAKKEAPAATSKDKKEEPVDFTQIKKDFEKVIADYPGSIAGQMAGIHLAGILIDEKNLDQALTTLQKVENKDKGLVNTLVQQQIGQLLADKEKCQDAIAVWQKIVDRKEAVFVHNEIKIQQALCFTKLNDLKKAEEILTNLANQVSTGAEASGSATSKEAEKYLRLLHFKKASGT